MTSSKPGHNVRVRPAEREKIPPAKQEFDTNQVTLKIYRRIAAVFVLLVAAVLLVVIYISTKEATIRLQPVGETVKAEMIVDIVKIPTLESEIRGQVAMVSLGKTKAFSPSGLGQKSVMGKARGAATIYNQSGASQPLVKTTRLLSSGGVLFRIDKDVEVPANGSAEVSIYADQEGQTGDIGPEKFTIPGLNEAKQKLIFAQSAESMKGGLAMVSVVSDQDIVNAQNALKTELEQEALEQLRAAIGANYDGEAFSTSIIDQKSTISAGEEAAEFELSLTIKVTGVFYDRAALLELATRKLYSFLTQGKDFARINTGGLQAVVEKADANNQLANLRVYLDGLAVPSRTSPALDPGRFAGMSEAQVRSLLISEGLAQNVQVDFFPFWVKSVPRLRDHVHIEIE